MANIINVDGRPALQVLWHLDDVHAQAAERGDTLTDEQAHAVLEQAARSHDATIGINWDVLDHSIGIVLTKTWG